MVVFRVLYWFCVMVLVLMYCFSVKMVMVFLWIVNVGVGIIGGSWFVKCELLSGNFFFRMGLLCVIFLLW